MESWQTCIWSCIPQIYGSLTQAKAIKSFQRVGGQQNTSNKVVCQAGAMVAEEPQGKEPKLIMVYYV